MEAEDFLDPRKEHIKHLEKAILETFRGKGVNPYVFNIMPELENPPENFEKIADKVKMGYIIGNP